ncbi:hypothetical protein [Adlercreutzia caecimuris]|uniref:hypothetical protein n=1 Tax=Adlercreutzia caecimuris TaxID=671266 RepID=UPI002729535A|nr:hypothetical protein [Adlercreutzia caecimuris]
MEATGMTMAATLVGLAFYCFVQGITPGPANLCSLATTLRYGRTLAVRQWYGLIAGFYAVSFASVLVVWTVGQVASGLMGWLTVAGAAYVLWLAWTMVAPRREGHGLYEVKPTAASGFLLQITNVKILVLCLTALCSYVLPLSDHPLALVAAGLVMPLIGIGCNLAWIYAGELLRSFYERHRRRVDGVMAASLALCAATMVAPLLGS